VVVLERGEVGDPPAVVADAVRLGVGPVELAVRAAGKVIERNLDVETNRTVVEKFLASIAPVGAKK